MEEVVKPENILEENLPRARKLNQENYLQERKSCCFWTYRYIGLAAVCLLYFGVVVMYYCPGALQTAIMKEFSYSLFKFSQLMSSYSWCSVFCFLGGYFVDRVSGLNLGLCVFATIFCIGNILYSTGLFLNLFWIMIIGRVFAGLGGEAIGALVNCYILLWFTGGTLNLAFAFSNSFSLLAPAFTYKISDPLYAIIRHKTESINSESRMWSLATASGVICGAVSISAVICVCIIVIIYKSIDHGVRSKPKKNKSYGNGLRNVKTILAFPASYWTLTSHITLVYLAMFNFISLSQDYFIKQHGLDITEADNLTSRCSLITCIMAPLMGYLVDKAGNNMLFLVASSLGTITTYVLLVFTKISPTIPVMILAASMSVFVSSYGPLVGQLVEPQQTATAYGITCSVANAGYSLGFILVGYISDKYGYNAAEYFYLSVTTGALIFWSATWILFRIKK